MLYAITANEQYGSACKAILEDIEQRRLEAIISVQVVSEVSGVLYRSFGVRDTTKYVDAVLSYPIKVITVSTEIIRMAAAHSRDWGILPYDGIHTATAMMENAEAILSADKGLDKVKSIKRLDPLAYKNSYR